MELLSIASGFGLAIFILLFFVVGVIVSEYDSFFMGSLTLLSGMSIMQWVFGIPVWSAVFSNPLIFILIVSVYVAAGSLYTAWWRFPNFIQKHKDSIQSKYESYIRSTYSPKTSEEFISQLKTDSNFEDYLDSSYYEYKAVKNKDRLASWVLMWPFAVSWELMHKPAIWVWDTVYNNLGQLFDTVSKNTARKMRKK